MKRFRLQIKGSPREIEFDSRKVRSQYVNYSFDDWIREARGTDRVSRVMIHTDNGASFEIKGARIVEVVDLPDPLEEREL